MPPPDGVMLSYDRQGFCLSYPQGEVAPIRFVIEGRESPLYWLDRTLRKQRLQGKRATLVLEPEDYRLLQLPRPDVAEAELDGVLRWRIRDLVDFDVEEAVIQTYPMPGQLHTTVQLLFVVVARRTLLQRYVETTHDAGLQLQTITTAELALNHHCGHALHENEATLLLALFQRKSYLLHRYQGAIYRVRELNFGMNQLQQHQSTSTEGGLDHLVEEINRFLVFCEHHCEGGRAEWVLLPEVLQQQAHFISELVERTGVSAERIITVSLGGDCLPVSWLPREVA